MQQVKHVWQQTEMTLSGADIEVGGVSLLPAHEGIKVAVHGEADVLRIFLRESFLDAAVEGQFACRALFNSHDIELLAAVMQLFDYCWEREKTTQHELPVADKWLTSVANIGTSATRAKEQSPLFCHAGSGSEYRMEPDQA